MADATGETREPLRVAFDFTLARLAREAIDLAELEAHLDRRGQKVTRRG